MLRLARLPLINNLKIMANSITKPATREIIADFADEIKRSKRPGAKPSKEVIYFRKEHLDNIERDVVEVRVGLLRFRKDNGRIASDVLSYERKHAPLFEENEDAQKTLKKFLQEKDPEKTNELIRSIQHTGQRAAAIITADGFLINGNRRKMALEELWDETKDERYQWMKVVILPGKDEPGGPPTVQEIEQIENRYQLQSEGRSEYYKFDRALSMRRKIEFGMSLEEQLRDDPNFVKLQKKEFDKKVREFEEDYIRPLECIDRYLEQLGREGLYGTISTGISDREGRWQAFYDYYKHVRKKLDDHHQRMKLGVEDDETGDVEEIAFKLIRKREFPGLPKLHKIMRDLPKWLANEDAKKELFELLEMDLELPEDDCFDEEGREYDERKKDQIWNGKYQEELIRRVKLAQQFFEHEKERETPLTLLEAALKKLEHENMVPEAVNVFDIQKAMELAREVKKAADDLESTFYHLKKKLDKVTKTKN